MRRKEKIKAAQNRIKELKTLIKLWETDERRKATKTLELSHS